jgi:hypothetical protein
MVVLLTLPALSEIQMLLPSGDTAMPLGSLATGNCRL